MSDTVRVSFELTTREYAAIADLLERDYSEEVSVTGYFQLCARDVAGESAGRSE